MKFCVRDSCTEPKYTKASQRGNNTMAAFFEICILLDYYQKRRLVSGES